MKSNGNDINYENEFRMYSNPIKNNVIGDSLVNRSNVAIMSPPQDSYRKGRATVARDV